MDTDLLYLDWKKNFDSILTSLADKQVILLFSGGKDSSLAFDLLLRAASDYGFSFTAHGGAYPVHRYQQDELRRLNAYWESRGAKIVWHKVAGSDEPLEKAENPCKECQELRRQKFSLFLRDHVKDWGKLVLVACYSLSDLVSYAVEHILAGFTNDLNTAQQRENRAMETAQRFYPVLEMREGYTVFRPLVYFDEETVRSYLREIKIPYLSVPCAYRSFRPKRILQDYYEKMGLRFDYHNLFQFMKNVQDFPLKHPYQAMNKEAYINRLF